MGEKVHVEGTVEHFIQQITTRAISGILEKGDEVVSASALTPILQPSRGQAGAEAGRALVEGGCYRARLRGSVGAAKGDPRRQVGFQRSDCMLYPSGGRGRGLLGSRPDGGSVSSDAGRTGRRRARLSWRPAHLARSVGIVLCVQVRFPWTLTMIAERSRRGPPYEGSDRCNYGERRRK